MTHDQIRHSFQITSAVHIIAMLTVDNYMIKNFHALFFF